MPEHYVVTDAGLKPADSLSQQNTARQIDSSASPPAVKSVTTSEPSNTESKVFDLRAVAREVQALGALHLDRKHDTRSFKNKQLQQLGIKLPKQPRLSAHAQSLACVVCFQ
jgi:Domain of unknown function (DUF4602)